MFIKQLSIFIENKEGRLAQVAETLKNNDINIISLSLADTSEYGLLRLIVSDPQAAKKALQENGYSAMLTDVIAVRLYHKMGMLEELLKIIYEAKLNIEYMYALSTSSESAAMILKTSDGAVLAKALEDHKMEMYDPETAYHINERS